MTFQTLIEIAIVAGTAILMVFCVVLARRLRRLNDLEDGLGGAIAVMAAEVDRLERSIRLARQEAMTAGEALAVQVRQAQSERARWDLHLKMRSAMPPQPERSPTPKLRKRRVSADA
ncbi:hypothetical protein FNJ84_16165 [Paracoccus sp. M683]|uniref:hypothetical protein n=1 Tax=Paracoccus sp. M683 TaxID=2594268 RepID=UPI0011816452|nr:hypothetical protein [Paracoccus sp. M683]TRW95513.1 hypothetical protein FNJ84_16165 [Paracoccus sp. M683]